MIRPSPLQRGQATMFTIWPRIVWLTRRRSPDPLHSGQVSGSVPGSPPEPPHTSQVTSVGNEMVVVTPLIASAKSMARS